MVSNKLLRRSRWGGGEGGGGLKPVLHSSNLDGPRSCCEDWKLSVYVYHFYFLFTERWQYNLQWKLKQVDDWKNWARSCENVSYAIWEQQRCRSACASAQSDQHLCFSLLRQYDTYTCFIKSFKIVTSFCSWAGWFETDLVENSWRQVFAWCGSDDDDIRNSFNTNILIWVAARQNQQNHLCAQRRLRSAWASAQSDQNLRCLHEET